MKRALIHRQPSTEGSIRAAALTARKDGGFWREEVLTFHEEGQTSALSLEFDGDFRDEAEVNITGCESGVHCDEASGASHQLDDANAIG